MISARNANQLKFQKRLIRAASQSPKVEAANLFAIVANNLDEFLTVRVPLDGDTDDALSEYVECMELLIQAVARKFPTFYSDHQIENISGLHLIDDEVNHWMESSLVTDEDRASFLKIELEATRLIAVRGAVIRRVIDELLMRGDAFPFMTQGGLFSYSHRFYHGYVWLLDLARKPNYNVAQDILRMYFANLTQATSADAVGRALDLGKYLNVSMVSEVLDSAKTAAHTWSNLLAQLRDAIESGDKKKKIFTPFVPEVHEVRLDTIAAPEHISVDQAVAYDHICKWIKEKHDPRNSPLVRVTFKWDPIQLMLDQATYATTMFEGGPIRLADRVFDTDDGVAYDFTFEVENPIVMNLPAVMHALVSQVNDFQGLVYEPDGPDLRAIRGFKEELGCKEELRPNGIAHLPRITRGPLEPNRGHPEIPQDLVNLIMTELDFPKELRTDFNAMTTVAVGDGTFDLNYYLIRDIHALATKYYTLGECRPDNSSHCWINESWLTLYRIDEVPQYVDQPLQGRMLALILFVASLLQTKFHVLVECRARGDEENNVRLVQLLQTAGADVRVVPSTKKFRTTKVHAKIWAFEWKNRPDDMTVITSTGNFSTEALEHFSDTYLLETKPKNRMSNVGVRNMLNCIFESTEPLPYDSRYEFFWAPKDIRRKLLGEIAWVKSHVTATRNTRGEILIKVNHLTDPEIVKALIDAADAGVRVFIIARTTCTIPTHHSPNLDVLSVCGKYLEHDRLFQFRISDSTPREQSGAPIGKVHTFMGSADLMPRNLDRRIEYLRWLPHQANDIVTRIFYGLIEHKSDSHSGIFVSYM